MKKLFFYSVLLLIPLLCNAQEKQNGITIRKNKNGMVKYVKFSKLVASNEIPLSSNDFFKKYLNISVNDQFRELPSVREEKISINKRFDQYYAGIKVDGAGYIIHYKNGKIYLAHGQYVKIEELNTFPVIDSEHAKDSYAVFKKISSELINNYKAQLLIKDKILH
jgi:bacillolysin